MNVQKVNSGEYTSFGIGGEADMVQVTNEGELVEAINLAKKSNKKIRILGEGTNTIFSNDLDEILIVRLVMKEVESNEAGDYVLVTAAAGVNWDELVSRTVTDGLWGIENLSLIPGTVGAAPVQNIGAYGVEVKDVIDAVYVYDMDLGKFYYMTNAECEFGYRDSIFKREKDRFVILKVVFKLSKAAKPVLTYKPLDSLLGEEGVSQIQIRNLVIKTRQEKLPDYKVYKNAGSFFKNVVIGREELDVLLGAYPDAPFHKFEDRYKVPTAWLIEHVANMKGVREGDVGSWSSQPLVLVNYGEASFEELMSFSQKIIDTIFQKVNLKIEREINVIL